MIHVDSKLPDGGITIFTVMSALATENQAINLGQGFPNFEPDQQLKDRIKHHLQNGKNQYCPMAGLYSLRETLAAKVNGAYGCNVNPDSDITITAGATQGIFTAISAFVHANDEVIILEPAYDCYRPTIEFLKARPIVYSLEGPDYKPDWDQIEDLINDQTKMIIINTPHNPVGKTLKEDDLLALENIVKEKNIIVLSDEVYEHLIYDGQKHQSVLRFPSLRNQAIAVYSFGKTFHSTGWKMGYCVGPEFLMKEFRKIHQWNVFSVNSFIQYALHDYMQEPKHYLDLPSFFQQKRDFLTHALGSSRLRPLSSEGTYFQLFDYSAISDLPDTEFAKLMTIKYGVAAIPVSVFYSQPKQEKVVRLCFAKTDALLAKAGDLLGKL